GTNNSGVHRNGPTRGVTPSAVPGSNAAIGYLGDNEYTYSDSVMGRPASYSVETWFKTDTTSGGKLMGFGHRQEQLEKPAAHFTNFDKHIYMTDGGRLAFGVNNRTNRTNTTIGTSRAFNNGRWHHVVATQGPGGMRIFVDGKLQASNSAVTTSQNYAGSWHAGGGPMGTNWPDRPSSVFFNGEIDEAAVYPRALSPAQIARHHQLGTQGTPW
ncbi:LamG domain-containing protein, partial [Streptomyces sp. NPDC093982]|uniref:LamG domain-containing protein n=1 Tax=Streptomyces sp. NPDC093982 TaxID=3155077 RepID=UPI00342FA60E